MNVNRFKITLHTAKGQFEELITGESIELGRNISADLPVMASGVSRSHLNIYVEGGRIKLKDLGSTNGTYIKGVRIEPHREIDYENGTRVSLGQAGCFVRIELARIGVKIDNSSARRHEHSQVDREIQPDTQITKLSEDTGIMSSLFGKSKNSNDPSDKRLQKRALVHVDQAERLIKKRIAEAEASIRKGIQKARIQAKDITNEARKEADIIKAKAQVEKNRMLAELDDSLSSQKSKILKEVHEQKLALEKELAERTLNLESEVSLAQGQIKKDMREAEALVKGAKSEVETLKEKQLKLNGEISDLLERKNVARQENKEIELKLATIEEVHKVKSEALDSELSFVKDEIEKSKNSLRAAIKANEKELENHKGDLSRVLEQTETMSKSLESVSADHSKLTLENQDLSDQNEELLIQHRHKKTEFEKTRMDLEQLLNQRDELEDSIVQTKKMEELRLQEYTQQVELEADKTLLEARRKADSLIGDAKNIADEAKIKADMIAQRASEAEKNLVESAERVYAEAAQKKVMILEAAVAEKEALLEGAVEEKKLVLIEVAELKATSLAEEKKIIDDAKTERDLFLKGAKEKFEQADIDYTAKMADFDEYRESEKKKLDAELDEQAFKAKKELERELAEIKVSETRSFEKEVEEQKRILDTYRADYAEVWSTAIVFKAQEIFKTSFGEDEKTKAREDLKTFAKAIINEQNPDEELEVQGLMRFDPARKERKKKFLRRASAFAVMGLFALMVSPYISKSVKEKAHQMAENSKKASQERVAKFEEERVKLKTFVPEKRDEYLKSYTDRVIYTTGYVENELSKEYREDWFLNLDTFFVEELILSDETIVTFISKETNLIKDLQSLKESVNAQFVDEGIARMQILEDKFIADVKKLVKTNKKFKKFENFKKDYYLKRFPFGAERSLANEVEEDSD